MGPDSGHIMRRSKKVDDAVDAGASHRQSSPCVLEQAMVNKRRQFALVGQIRRADMSEDAHVQGGTGRQLSRFYRVGEHAASGASRAAVPLFS